MPFDALWYPQEKIVHADQDLIVLRRLVLGKLVHQLIIILVQLGKVVHQIIDISDYHLQWLHCLSYRLCELFMNRQRLLTILMTTLLKLPQSLTILNFHFPRLASQQTHPLRKTYPVITLSHLLHFVTVHCQKLV